MDPASYCVYNATRNALLSERVISVSEPQTPSQLLALIMKGPGRDPHFCIRLNNVSVLPEIPRLFAFDVAYLDSEQRILAVADVGPGTPFPPIAEKVTTILFLSDQLLAQSNSEPGDIIRICTGAELAVLLRAAAQFNAIESPAHRFESAVPQSVPDPFDGSLIYLPSSGTPQTREIFVPHVRQADPVDPFSEVAFELSTSATQVSGEFTPSVLNIPDDIPEPSRSADPIPTLQSEPSLPELPAPVRLFDNASNTAQPSETLPRETMQSPPSPPSQLPFNLRAVIQLVDEQLRREQQQEKGQLSDVEEPSWFSGRTSFAEPPAVTPEPEDLLPESKEPLPISPEPEPSISTPVLANGNFEPESIDVAAPLRALAEASSIVEASAIVEAPVIGEPESQPSETPARVAPVAILEPISASTSTHQAPQLEPSPVLQNAQTAALEPVAEPAAPRPRPAPPKPRKAAKVPAQEPIPAPPEPERTVPITPKEKLPFAARVQRWLAGESISLSGNRRRGERIALPGMVAFYFTGGAPKGHEIVNISSSGLYLRSKELWSPNTLVRMTLEREDPALGEKKSISVLARVVRVDDGGIGHEFITTEVLTHLRARDLLPQEGTNRKELDKFLATPK